MKYIDILTGILLSLVLLSCNFNSSDSKQLRSGAKQALVYISDKDGGFNLYSRGIGKGTETMLSSDPGWEWMPQYSAYYKGIIYNSQDTTGQFRQALIDMDGDPRKLPRVTLPGFTIARNSSLVAYTRKSDETTSIIVCDLENPSDSINITENKAYNGRPKWSPDGNKLAYISDRSGSNEVYMYDTDSKSSIRLTRNEKREKYLSWAPDGIRLAATMSTDSTFNDIFIIDTQSSQMAQLTDTSTNEAEIAWSPDGNYIAYHAKLNGADDIFILELASGKVLKITDGAGYYGEPEWVNIN